MLRTHLSRIVAGVMLRIDVLLIAIWPPLRMPHLLHITPTILSRIFLQVCLFICRLWFKAGVPQEAACEGALTSV